MRDLKPDPVPAFAIIAEHDGEVHAITVVTDRHEAHRVWEDAQRLDDEVSAGGGVDPMRFTLANCNTVGEFFNVIATEAPDREPPEPPERQVDDPGPDLRAIQHEAWLQKHE